MPANAQSATFIATLVDVANSNGRIAFTIVYDNTVEKLALTYVADLVSDRSIAQTAANEIERLTAVTKAPPLTLAVGQVIDLRLADTPPVQPTADQIAEQEFFADYATWLGMLSEQRLGVRQVNDPESTALQADLQGRYLPSYRIGLR